MNLVACKGHHYDNEHRSQSQQIMDVQEKDATHPSGYVFGDGMKPATNSTIGSVRDVVSGRSYERVVADTCSGDIRATGKPKMVGLASICLLVLVDYDALADDRAKGYETCILVRGFFNAKGHHYDNECKAQQIMSVQEKDANHPNIFGGGMKPVINSTVSSARNVVAGRGYEKVVANTCCDDIYATGKPKMVGLASICLLVDFLVDDRAQACGTRVCGRLSKGRSDGKNNIKPMGVQEATRNNGFGVVMRPVARSSLKPTHAKLLVQRSSAFIDSNCSFYTEFLVVRILKLWYALYADLTLVAPEI